MPTYREVKRVNDLPRLLLEGSLDITYRCNNNCRHCWLRVPDTPDERERELRLEEIRRILEEARTLGCRTWGLSGGEPLLRPDFTDLFQLVTRRSAAYILNTNGTLITPKIARLMKKEGMKMVSLYGATAKVHDHITRTPGSFEAAMRGIAYLREAGAGFIVQIVPMRDNDHQMKWMVRLALSLSPVYRIGAPWLYPRADGDRERNREIFRQRLDPRRIAELEGPPAAAGEGLPSCAAPGQGRGLFSACVAVRRDFHVDPYGGASLCAFVRDPRLRYDLRKGSVAEFWNGFVPALADKVRGGKRYRENCGTCDLRADCQWCPVYGYLEEGSHTAKVDYLCAIARETRRLRQEREAAHVRYYRIAGVTVRVESDIAITEKTFLPKFKAFEIKEPGEDVVSIRHHFFIPDLASLRRGEPLYRNAPWVIYRTGDFWLYLVVSSEKGKEEIHQAALFNHDHSRGDIYNDGPARFRRGGFQSLTLFPSDQILLARVLADREGCYLHAGGLILDGNGLLFLGHSEAGKSTLLSMMKGEGEILCDDRIIVRKGSDGFRIHGTWSHGDLPDVSATSAPLRAVLFLRKAKENRLEPVADRRERIRRLLACLIKPLATADWWEKTLAVVEQMAFAVPCYDLYFDRSGKVLKLLRAFAWEKVPTWKK